MATKEIEPSLQTIGNYLKKDKLFRIPTYQRAYSWGIANCDKLWQDIKEYINNQDMEDPYYFFGTVIIDCSNEEKEKGGYFDLIDGQQRTTTFLLLIKAMFLRIKEVLATMPENPQTKGLERSLQQSLDTIYEILYHADVRKQLDIDGDWNKVKGIKILEDESIKELYKDELTKIIEAETFKDVEKTVCKLPHKQNDNNKYTNFFRNFKFFYDKLGEDCKDSTKLDEFAQAFLNKCQIIEIKSWQFGQAITMFNSLNSKGMPLSDTDIISAALLSKAQDKTSLQSILETIIRQADELNQKGIVDMDDVLQQNMYRNRAKKHQYNESEVTTPGVRRYYTEICKELLDEPITLCNDFKKILNIWTTIQNYPITKLLLKFNENFKHFLIPYLFRVPENELSEENITPIMECFIRLFTLLEVTDGVFSSKPFKVFLFNENFKLVDPSQSIDTIIKNFDDHIMDKWKEEAVVEDIKKYDKNILVYLNEYLYVKDHNLPFNLKNGIAVNVEHIMPGSGREKKTIRTDANMEEGEFEYYVNLLGNKILLEDSLNKSISNDWFKTKKDNYIKSSFGIAKALSNYPADKWGKQDIEDATQKVAERIVDFIFKEEPKNDNPS